MWLTLKSSQQGRNAALHSEPAYFTKGSPLRGKQRKERRNYESFDGLQVKQFVTVAVLPGRWLVHARLELGFTKYIAKAMDFAPARPPDAPVRRHHPGSFMKYAG
jgi:hypothetical protein